MGKYCSGTTFPFCKVGTSVKKSIMQASFYCKFVRAAQAHRSSKTLLFQIRAISGVSLHFGVTADLSCPIACRKREEGLSLCSRMAASSHDIWVGIAAFSETMPADAETSFSRRLRRKAGGPAEALTAILLAVRSNKLFV